MRRILTPLRFVVSGGLVAYLVWKADPASIWDVWQQADWRLLGLAFLLQLAGIALSAAKWGVILNARGKGQSYGWLLTTYLAGQFANNFLPTTVGGDALRAMQLGRRIGSFSQSSASIFLERLTGFLALSSIAILALLVSYIQVTGTSLVTDPLLLWATIGFALMAVGAAAASFTAPWLHHIFGAYMPRATHDPLKKIAVALSDYFPQGKSLALVVGMSLLFQSTWVVIHIICGIALGITAPLLLYALMVPLTDILGMLPIFFNNLGVREAIFILYLGQVGVGEETAIALALTIFAIRLVASLLGGLVVLFGGADLSAAREAQHAEPALRPEHSNTERTDRRVPQPAASGSDAVSRERY
jgi:hypothetical protein